MAFSHGKNAHFELGSAGTETTLVDISAFLNSISFPQTVDTGETTVFGDDSMTYVVGLRDSTISIEGRVDPTVDGQLAAALGNATPLDFEYGPAGIDAGNPQFTGSAFLTSYEIDSPVDDTVTFTAELQVTGDVTRGTY